MTQRQKAEKERLDLRKAEGQCVSCEKLALIGQVRCGSCADKRADYQRVHGNKAFRDRMRAAGLCIRCGGQTPEVPHVICGLCLKSAKDASQVRRRKDKADIFAHYGRTCTCCKQEFDEAFLTLNHVNNDGAEHKKTLGSESLYTWAKKNGYPASLETNCWNCNCARQVNGGICPHAVKRNAVGA